MVRFGREDFSGGERRRFKENYRSVKEVVSLFDRFASDMATGDYDGGLDAQRGSSGLKPELCTVDQAHQQPVVIADTIEAMCTLGKRYSDQAVLCSGNEKLSSLAQDLERLGVPVFFLGSLFERPEVKDALNLLSLLTDRRATGLVRMACWPEFAMSIADQLPPEQRGYNGWVATRTDKHSQSVRGGSRCPLRDLSDTGRF